MAVEHAFHIDEPCAVLRLTESEAFEHPLGRGGGKGTAVLIAGQVNEIHRGTSEDEHRFKIVSSGRFGEIQKDADTVSEIKLRESHKIAGFRIKHFVCEGIRLERNADGFGEGCLFRFISDRGDLEHSYLTSCISVAR